MLLRNLCALALATVVSACLAVSTAASAASEPTPTASATQDVAATLLCPFRARWDTGVRYEPGGSAIAYVWRGGQLKYIPSPASIVGDWRRIAVSRWAYIPAIARDTSLPCYEDAATPSSSGVSRRSPVNGPGVAALPG
jgi:hypothetical protein